MSLNKFNVHKKMNVLKNLFIYIYIYIDHFTRCKQHWSRSTSYFSFI